MPGTVARRLWGEVERLILSRLLTNRAVAPYLAFWAKLVVRKHKPLIIGITGTAGKTTTTAMIAGMLKHPAVAPFVGTVGATAGNLNSDRGVPLTLLRHQRPLPAGDPLRALARIPVEAMRLLRSTDYPRLFVVEFGAGKDGHLHRSTKWARPYIGVVTNIGPAHLDHFKTVDGVAEEKSALVRTPPASGLVIIGTGHDHVERLASLARAPVFRIEGRGLELARDIARAVGRHLRVPPDAIEKALAGFKPPDHRLNRLEFGSLTVIDDSYNANPLSMKLGLDTLAELAGANRRRVAVLGAMGELSDQAARYHREIGEYGRERCDVLIGVGEPAKEYAADHWFADSAECAEHIGRIIRPGDIVLVKGSNAVMMNRVVEKIRENAGYSAATMARASS